MQGRLDGASRRLRFAVVLQTPKDPQSAIYIGYESLGRELRDAGHSLTMFAPSDFPALRSVAGRWVPVVYPVAVAAWLCRHRRDFDLVIFHSYAGWLATSLPLRNRPPSVVAFHGLEPLYHRQLRLEDAAGGGQLSWRYRALQEILMPLMLRTACRRAAAVFCLNQQEAAFLAEERWATPGAVHVVPHGVAPEFFAPPRPIGAIRRLMFVGQWLPMKGIRYLAEAVTILMTRDPQLHLVCAGTLADAQTVRAAFPETLRARVTVYPRVDQATLARLYREVDAFVFPSLSEGFSRAIVEAMAAGLPIVTTEVARDVLRDGESALVVPRRSASAIIEAVDRLQRDPALAARLGAAAAHTAEAYRMKERLRETVELLVLTVNRALA